MRGRYSPPADSLEGRPEEFEAELELPLEKIKLRFGTPRWDDTNRVEGLLHRLFKPMGRSVPSGLFDPTEATGPTDPHGFPGERSAQATKRCTHHLE